MVGINFRQAWRAWLACQTLHVTVLAPVRSARQWLCRPAGERRLNGVGGARVQLTQHRHAFADDLRQVRW